MVKYGKPNAPGQCKHYDIYEKLNIYYFIAKIWLHVLFAPAVEILNSEAMPCGLRFLYVSGRTDKEKKNT